MSPNNAEPMRWGAVLTSAELDGVAASADWYRWIDKGRAPAPGVEVDAGGDRDGDLTLVAGLGVGEVMITAEWSRLAPKPDHHDPEAIESLTDRLHRARELNLEIWLCLVDGTLPGWFADDQGGFEDRANTNLVWPRHIDWVGETFGHLVDGWVPQREPLLWALRRHYLGLAPPGTTDATKGAEAVRAALLAESQAWRLLRGTSPVATYQTARLIRPARSTTSGQIDLKAQTRAGFVQKLLTDSWLRALTEGQAVIPGTPTVELDDLRGAFDRVVVELRPPVTVDADRSWTVERPAVERQIESLQLLTDELDSHPIVAAGSLAGIGESADDPVRADYELHLLEAVEDAARTTTVVGWWQSSIIDGYGLTNGFAPNPALIDSDGNETGSSQALRTAAEGSQ